MTSLYDVLKAQKLPTNDAYAGLMAKALKGSEIKEYTGSVPYTFTANGQPLIDWRISGNMLQSGTPTPDNPIYPQECSDIVTTGEHTGEYVLPIISGEVTTDIYLDNPLRKIDEYADTVNADGTMTSYIVKQTLTGEEDFEKTGANPNSIYIRTQIGLLDKYIADVISCSHCQYTNVSTATTGYGCDIINSSGQGYDYLAFRLQDLQSLSEFKTWLADQYSAGTPVTVWYVRTTPITKTIAVPEIPTTRGSNTLSVGTAVQPSGVYIKYMR